MRRPFAGWAVRRESWVRDSLKEGVLVPDIYDPTLNPLYRDVLAHYGVVALPCRIRDPDRKGKVEHLSKAKAQISSAVGIAETRLLVPWLQETLARDARVAPATRRNVMTSSLVLFTSGAER